MAVFDETDSAKLRAWSNYLSDGGLNRPVDAIPFDLIDLDKASLELAEFLGGVLTLAVLAGPEKAAWAVEGFLGGDHSFGRDAEDGIAKAMDALPLSDALDRLDATDDMLTNSAALVGLLAMWHDGTAKPVEPQQTLRKMILEPHGSQWDLSQERDEP